MSAIDSVLLNLTERSCRVFQRLTGNTDVWLTVLLFGPVAFVFINLRIPLILLTYSLIVLTTLVSYLLACDPLPPCVGKVREWWWRSSTAGETSESRRRA